MLKVGESAFPLWKVFLEVVKKCDNYGRSSGNAGRSASGSSSGGRCSRTGGGGQARSQIDGPESNAVATPAEGISSEEGKSREGASEGDESGQEGQSCTESITR